MQTIWFLLSLVLIGAFGGAFISSVIHDLRTRQVCPDCGRLVDRHALECPICGFDLSEPKEGV